MAKGTGNMLLQGIAGKLGKEMVVKHYGDKVVLAKYPNMDNIQASPLQKAKRNAFAEAMKYAQGQIRTVEGRALYTERATANKRPLNVAMADFYHAPEVIAIDVTALAGKAGDMLLIHAMDDFRVERVEVEITSPDGTLAESGEASLNANGLWEYRTMKDYETVAGLVIKARAWDRPGNVGEMVVAG